MYNYKILIVDDSYLNRMIIKNTLQLLGCHNCHERGDGASALQLLEEAVATREPFDVVFCGRAIKTLDGMELLIECKSRSELSLITFVMISNSAEKKEVITALKEGVNDYVIMPLSQEVLKRKTAAIFDKLTRIQDTEREMIVQSLKN